MPIVIVVPSVHHTGTKYVYNHLLPDEKGWIFITPNPDTSWVAREFKAAGATKGKVRIHIDTPLMPRAHAFLKEFPAMVPLRHPRAVAQSWKNRNKSLEWLDVQWKLLKEEVDSYSPFYIPLNDSELKEEFLCRAEKGLGVRFLHDWPIVCPGVAVEGDFPLDEEDEVWIKSWMEDGFFERFGYEY